jgi:hypothetical protein
MLEEYDPKKRFEEYRKEMEGQPIDPRAVGAGKRELELGRKGGFPVYNDEPDKAAKFKGDPEGELFKTDLTAEELQEKISVLFKARENIISFLEKPTIENFEISRETTLFDLEDGQRGRVGELSQAISALAEHDFDGNIKLFDLPQEIRETIEKDGIILKHLKRQSAK